MDTVSQTPALAGPSRIIARDERGRIIAGSASLNPSGVRPDGTSGKLSIRETIRAYLEDNPEEMKKVINHFVEKNPEFMWNMMEVAPPKGAVLMNPDGTALESGAKQLLEVTKLLNEIHGGTGVGGHGADAGPLDGQARDKDV